MRIDGKAPVKIGAFSRRGTTRGEYKASDHDFGSPEPYIPCGSLEEATAQLSVTCGRSATTSDCIVDTLTAWGQSLPPQEHHALERGQLKMDNRPESRGGRTQFLHRLVPWVDPLGKPRQLLSYPPSHRKYNPIERWGGIRELPGKGTLLGAADTRLEGAQRMTWKGIKPIVTLSRQVYAKGGTLSKTARPAVEARLERNPLFPTWDILLHPVRAT